MLSYDHYMLQAEFTRYGLVSLMISKGRKQTLSVSSETPITVSLTNGIV